MEGGLEGKHHFPGPPRAKLLPHILLEVWFFLAFLFLTPRVEPDPSTQLSAAPSLKQACWAFGCYLFSNNLSSLFVKVRKRSLRTLPNPRGRILLFLPAAFKSHPRRQPLNLNLNMKPLHLGVCGGWGRGSVATSGRAFVGENFEMPFRRLFGLLIFFL